MAYVQAGDKGRAKNGCRIMLKDGKRFHVPETEIEKAKGDGYALPSSSTPTKPPTLNKRAFAVDGGDIVDAAKWVETGLSVERLETIQAAIGSAVKTIAENEKAMKAKRDKTAKALKSAGLADDEIQRLVASL
jgi:hypothetical protein